MSNRILIENFDTRKVVNWFISKYQRNPDSKQQAYRAYEDYWSVEFVYEGTEEHYQKREKEEMQNVR